MPSFNDPNYNATNGTHTVNGVSSTVPLQSGSFSKSWTNTPNFRAKVQSREKLPTNTFTSTFIKSRNVEGAFSFGPTSTFPTGANQVSGVMYDSPTGQYCNWPVGHFGFGLYDSSVEDAAVVNLLNKIKGSSVNLAQAFAERKQTANLLTTSAIRIAKSVRSLRKGNVIQALSVLGYNPSANQLRKLRIRQFKSGGSKQARYNANAFAQSWLEIQYGWKPLLSDVYGSAEYLAKSLNRPKRYKATAGSQKSFELRRTVLYGFSDCLVVGQDFRTLSSCKMSVIYEVTSTAPRILAEVGISNPTLLAWELVPFSFVADWFVPIGNYLSTIDATSGVSFVSGTKATSWKADNRFIGNGRQHNGSNGNWTYAGHGSGSFEQSTNSRSPLSGFPSASIPTLKNPFSLTHVFNAIALLKLAFR